MRYTVIGVLSVAALLALMGFVVFRQVDCSVRLDCLDGSRPVLIREGLRCICVTDARRK